VLEGAVLYTTRFTPWEDALIPPLPRIEAIPRTLCRLSYPKPRRWNGARTRIFR
jgi:hypothetical protein